MAISKQTGVKISQYQTADSLNSLYPNRLTLDHYLISYAPAYFGSSTINKNFKVPVSTLRDDILSYIGVSNLKPHWRNTVKLWFGDWNSSDITNSYIATWSDENKNNHFYDFIDNKHTIENGIDKIFIIKNLPLP